MSKVQPLYLRLYSEPHLMDLVHLIGYQGLPVPEEREQMRRLNDQYGQDRMKAAARELLVIDTACEPPQARLSDTVRKLAWQLLGPPPEKLCGARF
jgi:hypothetical protein